MSTKPNPERNWTQISAVLTCSCIGCSWIRKIWQRATPDLIPQLDVLMQASEAEPIHRAAQALWPDADLEVLQEAIQACDCAACLGFNKMMSAPDHGKAELQTMMAALKDTPDATTKIRAFIQAQDKIQES